MKIDIPKAITAQIGILTSNIVEKKKNLDTKNIAKFKSLNKKKKKKSSDSRQRSEYPPPPLPLNLGLVSLLLFFVLLIVHCSEDRLLTNSHGWKDWLWGFTFLSTVFQSYRDDGRVNMKGSVQ